MNFKFVGKKDDDGEEVGVSLEVLRKRNFW